MEVEGSEGDLSEDGWRVGVRAGNLFQVSNGPDQFNSYLCFILDSTWLPLKIISVASTAIENGINGSAYPACYGLHSNQDLVLVAVSVKESLYYKCEPSP